MRIAALILAICGTPAVAAPPSDDPFTLLQQYYQTQLGCAWDNPPRPGALCVELRPYETALRAKGYCFDIGGSGRQPKYPGWSKIHGEFCK